MVHEGRKKWSSRQVEKITKNETEILWDSNKIEQKQSDKSTFNYIISYSKLVEERRKDIVEIGINLKETWNKKEEVFLINVDNFKFQETSYKRNQEKKGYEHLVRRKQQMKKFWAVKTANHLFRYDFQSFSNIDSRPMSKIRKIFKSESICPPNRHLL